MSFLFRRSFKTAIFNKFWEIAMATSCFMKEIYKDGIVPEC